MENLETGLLLFVRQKETHEVLEIRSLLQEELIQDRRDLKEIKNHL